MNSSRTIRAGYFKAGIQNIIGKRFKQTALLLYEITPSVVWTIRYCRSEQMKQHRRKVGDRGGIKFQGKVPTIREDGCTNTLTSILKDNLILEVRLYSR